jgi:lysophospholipase L1-like esterase
MCCISSSRSCKAFALPCRQPGSPSFSIKPSPARAALLPEIRRANALVEQFAATQPGVAYVDVFSPMLAADGHPRSELFRPDALHLNATGYALWKSVISRYVN